MVAVVIMLKTKISYSTASCAAPSFSRVSIISSPLVAKMHAVFISGHGSDGNCFAFQKVLEFPKRISVLGQFNSFFKILLEVLQWSLITDIDTSNCVLAGHK